MPSAEWQSGPERLELGPLTMRDPRSITIEEGLRVLIALLDFEKENPVYGCLYDVYRAGAVVGAVKLWEGGY